MFYRSILILTYGRSGSTLLQGLLNAIPGIVIRGENDNAFVHLFRFYQTLLTTHRRFPNSSKPTDPWFGANLLTPQHLSSVFSQFASDLLVPLSEPAQASVCFGFKEIRYFHLDDELPDYLDFLSFVFPDPCFIVLTRDLDEVCKSSWWIDQDPQLVKSLLSKFEISCANYSSGKPNFFSISYSQLVRDRVALRRLYGFLGVEYRDAVVELVLSTTHSYQASATGNFPSLSFLGLNALYCSRDLRRLISSNQLQLASDLVSSECDIYPHDCLRLLAASRFFFYIRDSDKLDQQIDRLSHCLMAEDTHSRQFYELLVSLGRFQEARIFLDGLLDAGAIVSDSMLANARWCLAKISAAHDCPSLVRAWQLTGIRWFPAEISPTSLLLSPSVVVHDVFSSPVASSSDTFQPWRELLSLSERPAHLIYDQDSALQFIGNHVSWCQELFLAASHGFMKSFILQFALLASDLDFLWTDGMFAPGFRAASILRSALSADTSLLCYKNDFPELTSAFFYCRRDCSFRRSLLCLSMEALASPLNIAVDFRPRLFQLALRRLLASQKDLVVRSLDAGVSASHLSSTDLNLIFCRQQGVFRSA